MSEKELSESYERFQELLERYGVTAYKVSKETGVTTATLTSWKQGKYTPKKEKLKKICDFFHVGYDYFEIQEMEKRLSEMSGELSAIISFDENAKQLMKCYFKLSEDKKKYILELAKMLSEEK